MNYQIFNDCFKFLCRSFDLDFDKKKDRMETYFDSKLGKMTEERFLFLIKIARETLIVKSGYLPPIRELVNLYYTTATNLNKPELITARENYHDAVCPICDNIGFVTLERKDGEMCGGFCCKCIRGQNKLINTQLGRELGCYTNWLEKGYKLPGEVVPF